MRTNATAVGIVLAAALIGLSAPDATAQAGKTLKIRFGNSQGLGETTADTMADFKKEVEAKSNGQIQVELYPAGQLGKIEEVVEMLRSGAVVRGPSPGFSGATRTDGPSSSPPAVRSWRWRRVWAARGGSGASRRSSARS